MNRVTRLPYLSRAAFGTKGNATGYDKRRVDIPINETRRNRVRPAVVSVDDVDFRFLDAIANGKRRAKIPVSAHRQRLSLESSSLRALKQRRSRRRQYKRVVHPAAQSFGEQENLTLTSAPFPAGVDVKNSKPLQPSSSCVANARKIRDPMAQENCSSPRVPLHREHPPVVDALSIASIIPSGARAVMRSPGARSRTL
jgi:hypothetical protein